MNSLAALQRKSTLKFQTNVPSQFVFGNLNISFSFCWKILSDLIVREII